RCGRRRSKSRRARKALPGHDSHVLFVVQHVCDWRTRGALSEGDFQKLFAFVRRVSVKTACARHLKHKISRGGEHTATAWAADWRRPLLFLRCGIPGRE